MNKRTMKKFLSLPANEDETWQGGIVSMANILELPGVEGTDEAGIVLWRSELSELVHACPFLPTSEESRIDNFVEIMLDFCKEQDFPFRPSRIECNDRELADGLSDLLQDSGTTVEYNTEMPQWTAVMRDVAEQFGAGGPPLAPSLRDAGCSDEQIREFAHAAAAFYRARPWDLLDDADLIKVESPKPPRYLKYAVVLGAGSQAYGLGFYNNPEDHYDLRSQQVDPMELSLFSLSFDPPGEVQNADIELWNELDLPLETGEAFPSMVLYSKKGLRQPTPKELDFGTVVLRALADTSEEEIDSGRWTKSVELLGKNKKCALSIPNLLDPPDRAEWMRRGMMPEMRGHERYFKIVQEFIEEEGDGMSFDELNAAINAKFTGRSIDTIELSGDTPADRAEAICQDAIESFGRRRIQLVKQALAEDPTHVEANILLAESTRSVDRRIELFRGAMETAERNLGSIIEEEVGHFWGIADTRPFMRACHGLADALDEAGQTSEAIEQYLEMLRLNPNDNQGVRYEVIPLMITHNREDEAVELLKRYSEETAQWHYTNSLAAFRRGGRSTTSKSAIRAAFHANPHVVELLQSNAPPFNPESYASGSPEEAYVCINELIDAWDETDGFVDWMFREYFMWEKEKSKKLRDRKRKQCKKKTGRNRRRK